MPEKTSKFPIEEQGSQNILGRMTGSALEMFGFGVVAAPAIAVEAASFGAKLLKRVVAGSVEQMSDDDFLTVDPDPALVAKIRTRREEAETSIITPKVRPTS